MTKFSIFLPRIDTRSLPPMSASPDQSSYEAACITCIQRVLAEQGIGHASRVSLLRKYTSEGYLFFVGFAHFDEGLAGTPSSLRFRTELGEENQSRLPLPGGHYWLVRTYRPRSAPNSTLEQQERLLHPPLPRPKLVRQNGGDQSILFRSLSQDLAQSPRKASRSGPPFLPSFLPSTVGTPAHSDAPERPLIQSPSQLDRKIQPTVLHLPSDIDTTEPEWRRIEIARFSPTR